MTSCCETLSRRLQWRSGIVTTFLSFTEYSKDYFRKAMVTAAQRLVWARVCLPRTGLTCFPTWQSRLGHKRPSAKQAMLPSDHGHCRALGSTGPYSTQLLSFIPSPWRSEIVTTFLLFTEYSKDYFTLTLSRCQVRMMPAISLRCPSS